MEIETRSKQFIRPEIMIMNIDRPVMIFVRMRLNLITGCFEVLFAIEIRNCVLLRPHVYRLNESESAKLSFCEPCMQIVLFREVLFSDSLLFILININEI